MTTLSLIRHPLAPAPYVRAVVANIESTAARSLMLGYRVEGDIGQLKLPAPVPAGRADELWKRTCFEVFVSGPALPGYFELNFSPSSEWAAYHFNTYREGMTSVASMRTLEIVCETHPDRFEASIDVPLDVLGDFGGHPLRLGISAVIQDCNGKTSYWALAHPASEPDFHHPDSFIFSP